MINKLLLLIYLLHLKQIGKQNDTLQSSHNNFPHNFTQIIHFFLFLITYRVIKKNLIGSILITTILL